MRIKVLSISHLFLEELLNGKVQLKYTEPKLPDDSKIVNFENDVTREIIKLYIESKEFPDVPEPEILHIVCFKYKKDWEKAIYEQVILS